MSALPAALLFWSFPLLIAQVPNLADLGSEWQGVTVCNSADDASRVPCGVNALNASMGNTMSFLMAIDQGCCYLPIDGVAHGVAYQPNGLTPSAPLGEIGFFGADQAVPSLANTLGSLHADWRGDPLGVSCLSFAPIAGPCEGWPGYSAAVPFPSRTSLGSKPIALLGPHRAKWQAFELTREVLAQDGVRIETAVRMPFMQQVVLFSITITNGRSSAVELGRLSMMLTALARSFDTVWNSPANNASWHPSLFESTLHPQADGTVVLGITERATGAVSAVSFRAGTSIAIQKSEGGFAAVSEPISLSPRGSWNLSFAWVLGSSGSAVAAAASLASPSAFATAWERAQTGLDSWWRSAFQPKNAHFSGHLPTLVTEDTKLRRVFYTKFLTNH